MKIDKTQLWLWLRGHNGCPWVLSVVRSRGLEDFLALLQQSHAKEFII